MNQTAGEPRVPVHSRDNNFEGVFLRSELKVSGDDPAYDLRAMKERKG